MYNIFKRFKKKIKFHFNGKKIEFFFLFIINKIYPRKIQVLVIVPEFTVFSLENSTFGQQPESVKMNHIPI